MSLLREIQNDVVDSNTDISAVLRKCKILAVRLGSAVFEKWVDQELNGYKSKKDLPDYRTLRVHSKGDFSGYGGRLLRNADIPLGSIPKEFREGLDKSYCVLPIATYIAMLGESRTENIREPWSPDLVSHVGQQIYEDMNCLTAWKSIPRAGVIGLIEAVRNRILNFVLEIEKEAPDAGEADAKHQKVSQERISQVFNTTIYGNVTNLAAGSSHVNQSVTVNIVKNDFESLRKYLNTIGMPGNEVAALEKAIKDDSKHDTKKEGFGVHVKNWLGSVTEKIARGMFPVAQQITAEVVVKALMLYFGIGS